MTHLFHLAYLGRHATQVGDVIHFDDGLPAPTQAELDATHAAALAAWTAAQTAVPASITKLTLKRRLDALGKWEAFKTFLESMGPQAVEDFSLAAEIRPTDPMFQQIAPLAKAALGLTDEAYHSLLTP